MKVNRSGPDMRAEASTPAPRARAAFDTHPARRYPEAHACHLALPETHRPLRLDSRPARSARPFLCRAPRGRGEAPPVADLRSKCPKVYDQGQLGSCTGNAIAAAIEFDLAKQRVKKVFTPSRLFIYYNERVIEHTVGQDSGAQIRDGIKSVNKLGAPPETLWPYSDSNPGPFSDRPARPFTRKRRSIRWCRTSGWRARSRR